MIRQKTIPFLMAAALPLAGLLVAAPARADDWYVGVAATMESFDAEYDKVTVNGPGSPRGDGNDFHSDDSADETVHGLGVFVGYRRPLETGGLYLSVELDFMSYGGQAQGVLPEVGNADGRNEYGENWSDDWSYKKERGYGLSFRLGMPFAAAWAGGDANLYALAGMRRTEMQVDLSFVGCPSEGACAGDADNDPVAGTFDRDATVTGWIIGGGLETRISERILLRAEIYHTRYENNRWVNYPADPNRDKISVPAEIDSEAFGFSLGAVWHF